MNRRCIDRLLIILVTAALSAVFTAEAASRTSHADCPYVPGEVLVRYRNAADLPSRARIRRNSRARLVRDYPRHSLELLKLEDGQDMETAIGRLNKDPLVQYAEPNWRVTPLGRVLPDDPRFPSQWHLDADFGDLVRVSSPGSSFIIALGDTVSIGTKVYEVDVDIDAPEAWAIMNSAYPSETYRSNVSVIDSGLSEAGVFDSTTGYLPGHEDLSASSLFANGPEASGSGGADDDHNGFIDDINGWDWYTSDDASLPGSEPDDDIPGEDPVPADSYTTSVQTDPDPADHSHGTLVSGIFSSGWDNGIGVASLGQNRVGVLPLRVYIGGTSGIDDLLSAIDYAAVLASNGGDIRVINASWRLAGNSPSQALKDTIRFAASRGLLFVAAAGNSGGDNDAAPVYPASHSVDPELEGFVLAVGSTSYDGHRSGFSNFGESSVQIGAPGTYILSTSDGEDGYSFASGTSFSTAVAAGLAGLLAGGHPTILASEMIERIVAGGQFDDNLAGVFKEGKRLNMAGALAPFHPYSKLVSMDSPCPVQMYSDSVSHAFGSILSAVSVDPEVAVMTTDLYGAWAVSPVTPGITSFELTFPSGKAPMEHFQTGPWRVTAISPFKVWNIEVGERLTFSTVRDLSGTATWEVEDPTVGTVSDEGVFEASGEGVTRVILLVDGLPYDASPPITVSSGSTRGSGGGCGTALPTGGDPGTGFAIVMLAGLLSFVLRRVRLAKANPESRVRSENPCRANGGK